MSNNKEGNKAARGMDKVVRRTQLGLGARLPLTRARERRESSYDD